MTLNTRLADRDWIIRTLLDPNATPEEVAAAARAATPKDREAALIQLDLSIAWDKDQRRDIQRRLAHLLGQHWKLGPSKGRSRRSEQVPEQVRNRWRFRCPRSEQGESAAAD